MISNIIMESLDREFVTVCKSSSVNYTRYADDITISGENVDALLAPRKRYPALLRGRGVQNLFLMKRNAESIRKQGAGSLRDWLSLLIKRYPWVAPENEKYPQPFIISQRERIPRKIISQTRGAGWRTLVVSSLNSFRQWSASMAPPFVKL
jgi:hypothetical protein